MGKRKHLDFDDKAYHPGRENRRQKTGEESMFNTRISRREVETEFGIVLNRHKHNLSPGGVRAFNFKLASVPGYQRIVPTKHSPGGSVTEGRTRTPRRRRFLTECNPGPFSILSDNLAYAAVHQPPLVTQLDPNTNFYESASYRAVKKIVAINKIQTLTISQGQFHRHPPRRECISQQEVMASIGKEKKLASANSYVASTGILTEDGIRKRNWEWLHAVAFDLLGPSSQTPDNLTAGTTVANNLMILLENGVKQLRKHFPITLEVCTDLIPTTHIGFQITYIIKIPDHELVFTISSQTNIEPHILYQSFFKFYFETIIERNALRKKKSLKADNLENKLYEANLQNHRDLAQSLLKIIDTDFNPEQETCVPPKKKPSCVPSDRLTRSNTNINNNNSFFNRTSTNPEHPSRHEILSKQRLKN